MKIIKLFLLLSLGLWAECKQNIPNENEIDMKLLQNVVENGWRDKNEMLNQFIIRYKKRALPIVLKIIDKPVRKVEPTGDDLYPIPKIRLTKDDYWSLLAYMKYLEHTGESEKVLNMYTQIFRGLNDIDDKSIISMIFRMTIEKITVVGLKQALESHRFTKEQKTILKQRLAETLLLDTQIFFDALETERKGIVKELAKDNTFQIIDFGKEVLEKVDSSLKSHNKEFYAIKTQEELEAYEKKLKEVQEKFLEVYNKWENSKNKNIPREKVINIVAGVIIFEGALKAHFVEVKIDLWKNIETNKALIKSLER